MGALRHTVRNSLASEVFDLVPAEGVEAETKSDGKSRGETELMWSSVDLVKAGWIEKDGTGLWSITDSGRCALEEHESATELVAEARRILYQEWDALRNEDKDEQLRTDHCCH